MAKKQIRRGFPPFHATNIGVVVLLLTAQAGLQVYQTWIYRDQAIIRENISTPVVLYLLVSGCIWFLAGLFIITGYLRRWKFIPLMIKVSAIVYSIFFWSDFWFIKNDVDYRGNWLFVLIANLILLVYFFWGLARPKSRQYFEQLTDPD